MARYSDFASSDEAVLVETDDFALVYDKQNRAFRKKRWSSSTKSWSNGWGAPCSAIVCKDASTVWAEDPYGKTIAQGEAGVDDASVIQSALDSLAAERAWKERVVLKGEFAIRATIEIPSYTELQIDGKLKASDGFEGHLIALVGDKTDIDVTGGELDGNKDNRPSEWWSGIIGTAKNVRIMGTKIHDFPGDGIDIHKDYSLGYTDVENIIIKDVHTYNNGAIGIYIGMGASKAIIQNCYSYNNGALQTDKEGIFFDGAGVGNIVKNCYCYNNKGEGLFASAQQHLTVKTLYTWDNGKCGIVVTGGLDKPNGIWVLSKHVTLENVHAYDNTVVGILIKDGVEDIKIKKGSVYSNGDNGLLVKMYSSDKIVKDVAIEDVFSKANTYNCIEVAGFSATASIKNVAIKNCIAKNAPTNYDGIRLNYVEKFIMEGCLAFDDQDTPTQDYGIKVINGADGRISNCIVYSNVSGGVSVPDGIKVEKIIGYATENWGSKTFSGDGTTADFEIGAHGLAITDPSKIVVKVSPASSDAIAASPCVGYVDPADNTKIRVKFASAPASGANNVQIVWEAQVVS